MKWFINMKVGTRLFSSFAVLLVFMVVLIGASILAMGNIQEGLDRIVTVNNVRASHGNTMVDMVRETSIAIRNMVLEDHVDAMQEMSKRMGQNRETYNEAFKKLEDMTNKDDTKGHEAIKAVKEVQEVARVANNKVSELALAGKKAEAIDMMNKDGRPAVRKWIDTVDKLIAHQENRNKARFEQAKAEYKSARIEMFTIGGIAILFAILIAIVMTKSIVGPLNKGLVFAQAVASGDLTKKIDLDQKDELGQLAAALNDMVEKLKTIVGEVMSASDNVASGSQELSATAQQMSQGATEQAASAEEISSSMEGPPASARIPTTPCRPKRSPSRVPLMPKRVAKP